MTLTKSLLSVTVVAVLLSGCEMNNAGKGAAIGAAAGGVLGKATGNHKDKRYFYWCSNRGTCGRSCWRLHG